MKLYLMRHGHAVSDTFDPERPLSNIGRAQVERLSRVLKANQIAFDRIWHSTKLRARQTAENLAEALALGPVLEKKEGLKPNDPVEPMADQIQQSFIEHPDIRLLIVSHIPFLPDLISFLIGSETIGRIPNFPEAGMVFLSRETKGPWRIGWKADPDTQKLQSVG